MTTTRSSHGSIRSAPPLSGFAKAALVLELFLSLGALVGGAALVLGPHGETIPLPVSALSGSPFDSYLVPGLVLFTVLGLGSMTAAALVWLRHSLAPAATIAIGAALLLWLAVEIAIVGYTNEPPLQPFYLLLGTVFTVIGLGWTAQSARGHLVESGGQS